jgi:hypothetical protein
MPRTERVNALLFFICSSFSEKMFEKVPPQADCAQFAERAFGKERRVARRSIEE